MLRSPLSSPLRSPLSSPLAARRGGGAPAFDPATLFASGELGGWYDPSDLSTLFQDTAGTVPVTAAGQLVARISDKSGNGNHLTQATEAARPLYQTADGLHWLDFDDAGDFMASAAGKTVSMPAYVCLAFRRINAIGRNLFGIVRNASNFLTVANTTGGSIVAGSSRESSLALVQTNASGVEIGQDAVCDVSFLPGSQSVIINGGAAVSSDNLWTGAAVITPCSYGIGLVTNSTTSTPTPLRFYGGLILEGNVNGARDACRAYFGQRAGVFF
jgi:hypothetical protein